MGTKNEDIKILDNFLAPGKILINVTLQLKNTFIVQTHIT